MPFAGDSRSTAIWNRSPTSPSPVRTFLPSAFTKSPPLVNRLHQLIIKPYRVVYEPVDEQIRVLAILRTHQLITESDTIWDK